MKRKYISKNEYNNLQKELALRAGKKRKQIANNLELAINEGDMRECDAYYVAMDMMIENDKRVKEIKAILKKSHTNNVDNKDIKVGSKLLIGVNGIKKKIEVVSSFAVDPFNNKLSLESNVGQILNNMKEGQTKTKSKLTVKLIRIF